MKPNLSDKLLKILEDSPFSEDCKAVLVTKLAEYAEIPSSLIGKTWDVLSEDYRRIEDIINIEQIINFAKNTDTLEEAMKICLNTNNYEEAIKIYNTPGLSSKGKEIFNKVAKEDFYAGYLYEGTGQLEKAIEYYEAKKSDPKKLAELYMETGQKSKAQPLFDKMINEARERFDKAKDKGAKAHCAFALAEIAKKADRVIMAEEFYNKAINYHAEQKNFDEAAEICKRTGRHEEEKVYRIFHKQFLGV